MWIPQTWTAHLQPLHSLKVFPVQYTEWRNFYTLVETQDPKNQKSFCRSAANTRLGQLRERPLHLLIRSTCDVCFAYVAVNLFCFQFFLSCTSFILLLFFLFSPFYSTERDLIRQPPFTLNKLIMIEIGFRLRVYMYKRALPGKKSSYITIHGAFLN